MKNKKIIPTLLTLFIYLVIGTYFYYAIQDGSQIEVEIKEEIKADDSAETHPASTILVINNGKSTISYQARLTTKDTLLELLEFHLEKSGLNFSKKEYTTGLVIEQINNVAANDSYVWKIYDGDKEVTEDLREYKLNDDTTYKAIYTKI